MQAQQRCSAHWQTKQRATRAHHRGRSEATHEQGAEGEAGEAGQVQAGQLQGVQGQGLRQPIGGQSAGVKPCGVQQHDDGTGQLQGAQRQARLAGCPAHAQACSHNWAGPNRGRKSLTCFLPPTRTFSVLKPTVPEILHSCVQGGAGPVRRGEIGGVELRRVERRRVERWRVKRRRVEQRRVEQRRVEIGGVQLRRVERRQEGRRRRVDRMRGGRWGAVGVAAQGLAPRRLLGGRPHPRARARARQTQVGRRVLGAQTPSPLPATLSFPRGTAVGELTQEPTHTGGSLVLVDTRTPARRPRLSCPRSTVQHGAGGCAHLTHPHRGGLVLVDAGAGDAGQHQLGRLANDLWVGAGRAG